MKLSRLQEHKEILKFLSILSNFFQEKFRETSKNYQFLAFIAFLLPLILCGEQGSPSVESEINESAHNPLTTLYGIPETNFYGVNVINGDYNFSCVDFELPGADPLVLQRTYCSSRHHSRAFFNAWTHNLSGNTISFQSDCKKYLNIIATGSLSGELKFERKIENEDQDLKTCRSIFRKGVTNCGKREISGRSNIKNMKASYSTNGICVKNADGTEHHYRRSVNRYQRKGPKSYRSSPNYESDNFLEQTIKPNGFKTVYQVKGHILHNVESFTHDGKLANEITFNFPQYPTTKDIKLNKLPFSIYSTSKDGKTAIYSFKWHKEHSKATGMNVLMSKFESNYLPSESYSYTHPDEGPEKLKKRLGDHHAIEIDYYKKADEIELYGNQPENITRSHVARHRVKKVSVAVDSAEDLQTAFRFAYYKNNQNKDSFTDVYNSCDHLTRFHYSTKNYRLKCIEKFEGTSPYTVYQRERLKFGSKETPFEGDLLYKTIEDSDGTVHYAESYDYDPSGNVLRKRLHYRTFTDCNIHPIFSRKNESLAGGEAKTTRFTYNDLNLPTSEDDGRLKTLLTYHKNQGKETHFLKSRLHQKNSNILRREFYEFDGNGACTLKIEDDGVTSSVENLEGVHCRKIYRCINRKHQFAGLPLEIDAWGSDGQCEQRISRTVFSYDPHGYVDKESYFDSNNQLAFEIHKVRDIQGNIVCETDPKGQTTHRKFNQYGSLLEEHGPNSDYYNEYTYDWLQRPIKVTRHCIDGTHLTTLKKYDLEGKLLEVTDSYGSKVEFNYNEHGRPIKIIHPPVRTENGWENPCESKQYNFLGHLISETNAKGAVTQYVPSDAGLPLKIIYPDGSFEEFRYSIFGEVLEKRQRNGSKALYTYDSFSRQKSEQIYDREGNLLKKSTKKYSGLLLISEKDGEGLITSYTYDYAGRVSEVRQGTALTKYKYDALGRVEQELRYFGEGDKDFIATQFTYDLLNQVIEKNETDETGKVHSKMVVSYDSDGNKTSSTVWNHAGESTTTHNYDSRGNQSSTTDPLGNTTYTHHRYDYIFEGLNLPCLEVTDPTGVKTVTVSDSRGLAILNQVYSPSGKLLSHEEMFYDLQGNMVKKEQQLSKEIIVTLWEYDPSSRLIRQTNAAGTEEEIVTTFVYNSFGELSETHYADGTSKYRIYDELGRLLEEWSDDKSIHYRYKYNRQDLPILVENCQTGKQTVRKYTLEKNLKSERFENGLKIGYRYDKINRLIECTYPDGSSVKQTYNPAFLEKVERIKNGKVLYEASFNGFDLSGKPNEIIFPKNGGNLKLSYDSLNRPVRLSYRRYKEKNISYDRRGLLTSKTVNNKLQTFDHDHLRQLVLEKATQYSHVYKNDALNRQVAVDGCRQIHNALHQLIQGNNEEYKYDAKGRRKQSSTSLYLYDKFDRLIGVKNGDSIWSYTFDAFNRKMSRTFMGETTYYLYNGHEEIGSFKSKLRCLDLKILSSKEGSIPIAIELGAQHYAPLISSQGHIVGLVEMETGKRADLSPLTMFGKDLTQNPLSPWRFCGKRHEVAELGIIDFGYRFYHPKSAQWLTQDPLGESEGPNLYAYVKNNPACFVDRFGLFGDGFSFSEAWDNVKEVCGNCWDSVVDTFSSWDNFSDRCCWAGNQACEYTYRSDRFMGCVQAAGGLSEIAAGYGVCFSSYGAACPLGFAMVVHGSDNCVTGFNQCWYGEQRKTLTSQLLENTGLSADSALALEAVLSISLAKGASASLTFMSKGAAAGQAAPIIMGFKPLILEGNKDWGLKHIMKRHSYESTAKNASKFLPGMAREEIRALVNEGYPQVTKWNIGKNLLLEGTVDFGRTIGTRRLDGSPTSQLLIILEKDKLYTTYPL